MEVCVCQPLPTAQFPNSLHFKMFKCLYHHHHRVCVCVCVHIFEHVAIRRKLGRVHSVSFLWDPMIKLRPSTNKHFTTKQCHQRHHSRLAILFTKEQNEWLCSEDHTSEWIYEMQPLQKWNAVSRSQKSTWAAGRVAHAWDPWVWEEEARGAWAQPGLHSKTLLQNHTNASIWEPRPEIPLISRDLTAQSYPETSDNYNVNLQLRSI